MTDNPQPKMPASTPPNSSDATPGSGRLGKILVAIVLLLAFSVAAYSLVMMGPKGESDSERSNRSRLDLAGYLRVAPELIGFEQVAAFPVSMAAPVAIAMGPDALFYVAGESAIDVFDRRGQLIRSMTLEQPAHSLAVAGEGTAEPGQIYVGTRNAVLLLGPDGKLIKRWPELGEKSLLTAIAVTSENVFVADAGESVVVRYDREGNVVGRIGEQTPGRETQPFVIPSPYFDFVVDLDETLSIVNPGARRIESYTYDGKLQSFWGGSGTKIADFFGCCNPAHLARLSDGRFVTSEKGIPRVKVYTRDGDFESVVADPSMLEVPASAIGDARTDQAKRIFDVAVTPDNEIVVLDLRGRTVRIFQTKPEPAE